LKSPPRDTHPHSELLFLHVFAFQFFFHFPGGQLTPFALCADAHGHACDFVARVSVSDQLGVSSHGVDIVATTSARDSAPKINLDPRIDSNAETAIGVNLSNQSNFCLIFFPPLSRGQSRRCCAFVA